MRGTYRRRRFGSTFVSGLALVVTSTSGQRIGPHGDVLVDARFEVITRCPRVLAQLSPIEGSANSLELVETYTSPSHRLVS